jgi:hypothetical protein
VIQWGLVRGWRSFRFVATLRKPDESRRDLIELTRDGSAAHRLARRDNVLLLLDDGMSCECRSRAALPFLKPR